MKLTKLISGLFTTLLLCLMVFSLSSKTDPSDWYDYKPCETTINNDLCTGKIRLTFDGFANNPYRKPTFETFVPRPDVRFGDFPPASSLSQKNNYYCSVIVTTDGCSKWEWSKVFDGNSNVMDIKLPPSGYNVKLKVTYYERSENFDSSTGPVTVDFNRNEGTSIATRVVYKYERTFLGGFCGSAPEPLNLIANGHVGQYGATITSINPNDDIRYYDDIFYKDVFMYP